MSINVSIKPTREEMELIAEGSFDVMCLPYQYANWAAEVLGRTQRYHAGGVMEIGALVDLYDACAMELESGVG